MHTEDPNTPAVPDEPAATAAETAASPEATSDSAPPADQVDAFSAGVEAARELEAKEAAPVAAPDGEGAPQPEPQPEAATGADGETPVAKPEGGNAPAAEPTQPQSVDEEVKQLGLKERAAERFRDLHSRAEEGIRYRQQAEQWQQAVESTGATPQQFGSALQYLAAINSGDPARMGAAYDQMQQELQWLGKQLGREAPGFDPLSAHQDLAARVSAGEMTREVALELAQHRQQGQLHQSHVQAQQEKVQQDAQYQQGLASVQQLGAHLRASDPQFDQKLQLLAPAIDLIQRTLPPAQWQQEIHRAYLNLPATAVAAPPAAPVRSAPNPIRPASGAPVAPKITVENAFEIGVQQARARGL